MNSDYLKFQQLPDQDRRDVFEAAAERLGTTAQVIEKDVWVCRTIDALFKGLGHLPKLYFKGGTSLSKGFGLIHRFSEDIDIVVSRPGLRIKGALDPFHESMTSGQLRKKAAENVRATCSKHVLEKMHGRIAKLLPECVITPDADDPDQSTLRVAFPSIVPADLYVKEWVKIECGARGADEPHMPRPITPYIQDELNGGSPGVWNLTIPRVTIIRPERTLWEKALILHAINSSFSKTGKTPKDKNLVSRHYYDVAMMHGTKEGRAALKNLALLENVRLHKLVMFYQASHGLDEAIPGKLRLVPAEPIVAPPRTDYEQMANMMFGTAPPFDWVLGRIAEFEAAINAPPAKAA